MTQYLEPAREESMSLATKKASSLFPPRREDYQMIVAPNGEHVILMPIKDYRRFRGTASFWQFMFLMVAAGFGGLFYVAMTRPPVVVNQPFVVEKQTPIVVPSKCLFLCK